VAGTDTGHDTATEPLATFAQNRQKLLDYAFRSLHTTAETGKQIATAYYGSKPTCSSFEGCSTGGRQSLILAQRFPDDFDGIIAGAPDMFHCGGGIGCSTFDKLGPVVQWVEKGIAPDSIIGSRIVNGKPDRTRPLCPYPQTAKYKGTGSIDDAANFVCK
jgi:hypothetical protein